MNFKTIAITVLLVTFAYFVWSSVNMSDQPRAGETAPLFSLENGTSQIYKLDDFRGKVVFLNFFSHDCSPCREEMSSMKKLSETIDPDGFVMVLVTPEENVQEVEKFMNRNGFNFLVLYDRTGDTLAKYGTYMFPETFVIDKDGVINSHFMGAYDWFSDNMRSYFSEIVR